MSWLSELFSGGKNPADAANQYYNQIPGAVNPYYQPYIDQGQNANKTLQEQYNKLLGDPGALYSDLGKGYKESPGYQFKLKQALQSGTNAAAAGGLAGSLSHQQQSQQTANDIANQDFEEYINHILGLYGTGLQGEQGFSQQGFDASKGYGDILGSNLAQQAGAAYQGQAAQNANKSALFGNFLNLGATGLGSLLGNRNKPWNDPGSIPGWK